MPNIDETAKRWQEATAARVGKAVQSRRAQLGMSVTQLAEATAKLGFPIHRVAIGKIESGNRLGKLDTSELVILAKALGVEPLSLLYPDMIDGVVDVTPNDAVPTVQAVRWFCGRDEDVHTSLRTYWDYEHERERQREYEKRGSGDAAYEAGRQAQAILDQGRAMWGWLLDE
ncbi:helix-turn-helix transcriptional regulator [Mycolicibacterium neoaurum]|uniref:helix-turn-helix domain-containing protein n=1 Tax=Mycolicibacterium neoaurum TaxID=1795 RepID=UPI00248C35EA|nr:helix-turn-helix transcriptional regulator [Mycolicibacterium neoaurum]WBP92790.1 helix-turn-helix transcriptional regulator [Mycolicibacterium neoaurum]WBS06352.1 helix-turn-helix transcriptional regulator [Mycolicibacterium neoaurum]